MQKPSRLCSRVRLRRVLYYLGLFTLAFFISDKVIHCFGGGHCNILDFIHSAPHYTQYVDQNGEYLSYSGHKILQLVQIPLSENLISLKTYLNTQTELTSYFRLVPSYAYHITLTNLKSQITLNEKQAAGLMAEQQLLDQEQTATICNGDKEIIIENSEIRLPLQLTEAHFVNALKTYQARWDKGFGDLVSQHATTFYITLAYQYKPIPSQEIYDRLINALKQWSMYPVDISLDPIEICSYTNLISYEAVLPDIIAE